MRSQPRSFPFSNWIREHEDLARVVACYVGIVLCSIGGVVFVTILLIDCGLQDQHKHDPFQWNFSYLGSVFVIDFQNELASEQEDAFVRKVANNIDKKLKASSTALNAPVDCESSVTYVVCSKFKSRIYSAPPPKKVSKEMLDQLKELPATYTKPGAIPLNSSIPFQLAIQTSPSQNVPRLFNGMPGNVESVEINVAEKMATKLTAPTDMFEVKLRGDEPKRLITSAASVTWVWDVKALQPGSATVTLEVFAYLNDDDEGQGIVFRVYTDTWDVETPTGEYIRYLIDHYGGVYKFGAGVIASIGSILTWVGVKSRRSKKKSGKNEGNSPPPEDKTALDGDADEN